MRADAQRNREALLEHAEQLFTARGFDVPLDEISRHAGVSIATLYRHFASREELVAALVEAKLTPVAEYTIRQSRSDAAPLEALWATMAYSAKRHTRDAALSQLWRTADDAVINAVARRIGLWAATERLLAACHRSGVVRAEVNVTDVARAFYALGGVIEAGHAKDWRRFLATYVRGLLTDPTSLDPLLRRRSS